MNGDRHDRRVLGLLGGVERHGAVVLSYGASFEYAGVNVGPGVVAGSYGCMGEGEDEAQTECPWQAHRGRPLASDERRCGSPVAK